MPSKFLAYTITAPLINNNPPIVRIGSGLVRSSGEVIVRPALPQNDSYWIVILSAQDPRQKVTEWIVPGDNNAVPSGIESYMDNPAYLFVVATQALWTANVPLDGFYNFLAKYGAGAELQKVEQIHSAMGYSQFGRTGYILAGTCGPRTPAAPPAYEAASLGSSSDSNPALLALSLESLPNGQPPYGISESYTWIPRPPHGLVAPEE